MWSFKDFDANYLRLIRAFDPDLQGKYIDILYRILLYNHHFRHIYPLNLSIMMSRYDKYHFRSWDQSTPLDIRTDNQHRLVDKFRRLDTARFGMLWFDSLIQKSQSDRHNYSSNGLRGKCRYFHRVLGYKV